MTWINGPTLEGLKNDADLDLTDTTLDDVLQFQLDSVIDYVQRCRSDLNYDGDIANPNPAPGADFVLGVYRLAIRWNTRRRSPEGLITAGDLGTARIPAYDADIERMLGIGRFRKLGFA